MFAILIQIVIMSPKIVVHTWNFQLDDNIGHYIYIGIISMYSVISFYMF